MSKLYDVMIERLDGIVDVKPFATRDQAEAEFDRVAELAGNGMIDAKSISAGGPDLNRTWG